MDEEQIKNFAESFGIEVNYEYRVKMPNGTEVLFNNRHDVDKFCEKFEAPHILEVKKVFVPKEFMYNQRKLNEFEKDGKNDKYN